MELTLSIQVHFQLGPSDPRQTVAAVSIPPVLAVHANRGTIGAMEPTPGPTEIDETPAAADGMARLVEGSARLGLQLTPAQCVQFALYYRELVAWNERLNLTAITGYEDVQVKHFLDSLASLPLIAEELGMPLPWTQPLRLVDVGSGAGFPGIPLKLAAPSLDLTLMDGTHKKIVFLEDVVAKLGLASAKVVHGRAEELGRKVDHRDHYDLVAARAVAPLNALVEYLLPLVRPGGLAVVYKGPGAPQEFVEARQAIKLLGGEAIRLAPVEVPFLAERRFILLIKKLRPTPSQFPRGQGLARKRPLA